MNICSFLLNLHKLHKLLNNYAKQKKVQKNNDATTNGRI
jgi:hypothetical protein